MVEKEEGEHKLKQEIEELGREVFALREERVKVRRNVQLKMERDQAVFREFKCEVYAFVKN